MPAAVDGVAETVQAAARRSEVGGIVKVAAAISSDQASLSADTFAPLGHKIPDGWSRTTLARLAQEQMQNGVFFRPAHKGKGVPIINVGDLFKGAPINTEHLDLFDASPDARARFAVKRGDLFFTRSSIVPAGIAFCNWYNGTNDEPVVFDSHVIRFRPSALKVLPEFLFRYCVGPQARAFFVSHAKSGTMTTIDQEVLGRCPVWLPPPAEQAAIAEALSDADALIESLESLISKKRAIKQGAMHELLSGCRRLQSFGGVWEEQELRDVCIKIQDGTHFSPRMGGTDFLYVTSKNVGRGRMNLEAVETISADEHAKIYARCDARKGDLLLTKDGASTGNAAINSIDDPISLLSSVAMLRFDPNKHSAEFFLQQILSEEGQHQIKALMSGNAITRLTLTKIRSLRFLVPPFEEQAAVAKVLSEMDRSLVALEGRLRKTQEIRQGMMQELLTGRVRLV